MSFSFSRLPETLTRPKVFGVLVAILVPVWAWVIFWANLIAVKCGGPILDFTQTFDPTTTHMWLTNCGIAGRQEYSRLLMVDMVFPVLYSLFYAACLFWVLKPFMKKYTWIATIPFLAFIGGAFDWIENLFAALMLWSFPHESAYLAIARDSMTMGKNGTAGIALVIIVIGLLVRLWGKVANKK